MKSLKYYMLLLFVLTIKVNAQFDLDSFIDEPFNNKYDEIKNRFADKKIEEKEVMNFKAVTYFDWIEPVSVKIGYMFSSDNKQKGKVVSNAKDNQEDAVKAFEIFKNMLIKKFGSNYSDSNFMGMTMLMWKNIERFTVMLTRKEAKAMLTILLN